MPPKQTIAKHPESQVRPLSNILTLEYLRDDPKFRDFWSETLKGIRQFGMNEAMLAYMHSPKVRKGTIDTINAHAALDMHRLEGSLEVWEVLLSLLEKKVEAPEVPDEEETATQSL